MTKIKKIKVRFVSDEKCIYLKKDEIYDAYRPKDDLKGRWFAIYIEDDDEPGDYAFPARWFEVVTDE